MISLQGIDHVVLRVNDLPRMVDFYCRILGCRIERRRDERKLVQLRAGGALIDLVARSAVHATPESHEEREEYRNLDHFCLRVEPFEGEELRRYLAQCGVATAPIVTRFGAEGEGPSIYLDDPEGNTIELKGPAARGSIPGTDSSFARSE